MHSRKLIAGFFVLMALCAGAVADGMSRGEDKGEAPVSLPPKAGGVVAQRAPTVDTAVKLLHARKYRDVTNLVRRGENYVGQATDSFGVRVRIVMSARTGDIVGLSVVIPKKK